MEWNSLKKKFYQMLLNGWVVIEEKKFIDELEEFCKSREFATIASNLSKSTTTK